MEDPTPVHMWSALTGLEDNDYNNNKDNSSNSKEGMKQVERQVGGFQRVLDVGSGGGEA